MTTETNIKPKTVKKIKGIIDSIYDLTQEEYYGGFNKMGAYYKKVGTILVERGSLIKTGNLRWAHYKWNPIAMRPTNVFAISVAERLFEKIAESKKKRDKVKKQEQESPVLETPISQPVSNPLSPFSIQGLWDEIKRRECVIHENKLALPTIQYQYFD